MFYDFQHAVYIYIIEFTKPRLISEAKSNDMKERIL